MNVAELAKRYLDEVMGSESQLDLELADKLLSHPKSTGVSKILHNGALHFLGSAITYLVTQKGALDRASIEQEIDRRYSLVFENWEKEGERYKRPCSPADAVDVIQTMRACGLKPKPDRGISDLTANLFLSSQGHRNLMLLKDGKWIGRD